MAARKWQQKPAREAEAHAQHRAHSWMGCSPAGPQGPHLGDTQHLWSHACPGGPPARAHRLRDKASAARLLCRCSGGRASPLSAARLQSGSSGSSLLGPSDSWRASSQPLPASRGAFPGLASGLLEGGLRPRTFPRFRSGGDLCWWRQRSRTPAGWGHSSESQRTGHRPPPPEHRGVWPLQPLWGQSGPCPRGRWCPRSPLGPPQAGP